ncbi:MAG TPA: hypothetical protein P5181_12510 [Dermatophilaceae bacterium]|nr:hypothetical protein [Dermatophilaceae bacterium]
MRLTDVLPVSDRGSIYAYLNQLDLSDHLDASLDADHRWDVDLTARRLVFSDSHGRQVEATVDLMASISPGAGSLLWGWAHPQSTGPFAERLAEVGRQHGIRALTDRTVPLPTADAGDDLDNEIAQLAHQVGSVVVATTGVRHSYSAPAGDTRVVFAMHDVDLPPLRIDHRVPLRIGEALGNQQVHDHRGAVHGLAELAGWRIAWDPAWTRAEVTDPDNGNAFTASFDAQARLTGLEAHLSPR